MYPKSKNTKHIIIGASLAAATLLTSFSSTAAGFGVEARSLGMGNASVATADIATAALTNPAMLALQKQEEDFSLLLPSVGVFIDDSDGLVDLMDQFQVEADACRLGNNAACTNAQNLFQNDMNGKVISPQVSGALVLGVSGETFSFALSARSDVVFAGGVAGPTDFTAGGIDGAGVNQLQLIGLQTTEVGVSVAGNYEIAGLKIAVGVTPKIVNAELMTHNENVFTLDTDAGGLIDDDNVVDLGSTTTMDAGVMLGLTEKIQLGVVARNLISDELVSGPTTIKFDTQLRAGIAYNGDITTLGIDLDLTENEAIVGGGKTQLAAVGLEIDAFELVQLRVGMQKNIADTAINEDALLTAGVGLSFGVHIDAAVISGNDTFGAYVQTGFRF